MDFSESLTIPNPKMLSILQEIYSTIVSIVTTSQMANFASFTWVTYDWITNMDDEVEYFWEQPALITVLYFLVRYYNMVVLALGALLPLLVEPSPSFCVRSGKFQAAAGVIIVTSVELVLVMRLYALYQGSKRLLVALLFGLLGTMAYVSYIIAKFYRQTKIFTRLVPSIEYDTCLSTRDTSSYWTLWIAPLAFQSVSFGLAAFKAIQAFKLAHTKQPQIGKRLVNVLIRDSMIYFVIVAIAECAALLAWRFGTPSLMQASTGMVSATFTIVSCRLLINLRAAARGSRTDQVSAWGAPAGESFLPTNIGGNVMSITRKSEGHSIELDQWRYEPSINTA